MHIVETLALLAKELDALKQALSVHHASSEERIEQFHVATPGHERDTYAPIIAEVTDTPALPDLYHADWSNPATFAAGADVALNVPPDTVTFNSAFQGNTLLCNTLRSYTLIKSSFCFQQKWC